MFKSIKYKLLFLLIMRILPLVMDKVTPLLRDRLIDFIRSYEKEASETPNPYDDVLAELLKVIFGIED